MNSAALDILEGKESEQNWEPRDRLLRLLLQNKPTMSTPELDAVRERLQSILACAHSLRTQLMVSACALLEGLAGGLSEQQAEMALLSLLKVAAGTKKIAAQAATDALKGVVERVRPERLLAVFSATMTDKNPALRARVMDLVDVVSGRAYEEAAFGSLLRRALSDASSEVRQKAARVCSGLEGIDPAWHVRFTDSLDANTRKHLVRKEQAQPRPALADLIRLQRSPPAADTETEIAQHAVEEAAQHVFEEVAQHAFEEVAQHAFEEVAQHAFEEESVFSAMDVDATVGEADDPEVILQLDRKKTARSPLFQAIAVVDDTEMPKAPSSGARPEAAQPWDGDTKPVSGTTGLLLGKPLSPRQRINSLGLAVSTPMRKLFQMQEFEQRRVSLPTSLAAPQGSIIPAAMLETLIRRIGDDSAGRLAALQKLLLLTGSPMDQVSVWNVQTIPTLLGELARWVEAFDASAQEIATKIAAVLCVRHKVEILNAGCLPSTLYIWSVLASPTDPLDESLADLLGAALDPSEMVAFLRGHLTVFGMRVVARWLREHRDQCVFLLANAAPLLLLSLNNPDTLVRKTTIELAAAARLLVSEHEFEAVLGSRLSTPQRRLLDHYCSGSGSGNKQ